MPEDIVTPDLTSSTELISGWDWENKHVSQSYTVNDEQQNLKDHHSTVKDFHQHTSLGVRIGHFACPI